MKKILILLLSIISLSVYSQTTDVIRQDTIKHVAKGNDTKLYHSANKYELETNKDSFNFNKPIFVNGIPIAGGNPDSLFHVDTQTWLTNGDSIPKDDSSRYSYTATKITTDSIEADDDLIMFSSESAVFNFGGNSYTFDGSYWYDSSDSLAPMSFVRNLIAVIPGSDSSWKSTIQDTLNVSDVGKVYKSGSSEMTISTNTNTDMAITSDRDMNITSEQLTINSSSNPVNINVGTNNFNVISQGYTITMTGDTLFLNEENLKAKTVSAGDSLQYPDGSWTTGTSSIQTVIQSLEFDSLQVDKIVGATNPDSVTVDADLYINGRVIVSDRYEAFAYEDPDSTITTSLTTSWIFLGSGGNNKFTNALDIGFSFDGDTLYFVPDADDLRDSVKFTINYGGQSATSSVNKSVYMGIFIKSDGESVYTEYRPATKVSRTTSSGVYYPGPDCTPSPIWLKDGDKIQIQTKCAATTTTLSVQNFSIRLKED